MKNAPFFLSLISVIIFANEAPKKWIPIIAIENNSHSKPDANHSKPPHQQTRMIQNIKVIKNLLDHVKKDGVSEADDKNWYTLESVDP
jgi:hypothetical protein